MDIEVPGPQKRVASLISKDKGESQIEEKQAPAKEEEKAEVNIVLFRSSKKNRTPMI